VHRSDEQKQILIADDEPNLRRVLAAQLVRDGFDVHTAEDGEEALRILAEHHIDVLITDLRMPKLDGLALLRKSVVEYPDVPVIMITAHGTIDTAVEALKHGAFDYVTKPFDRAEFQHVVTKAARLRELAGRAYLSGAAEERGREHLIGEAPAMRAVYETLDRVSDSGSTVLLTGESGTGKELIARAIHERSGRRDRPYIRVNCAAIPPELIESELFGYERGAFAGAVARKPGRFELADTGTLFLDEVGELPPSVQVKLLRAVQDGELERVGGVDTLRVDVRLIAATNRSLADEIARGRFREDLYYRLNVVHLHLPPLRERRSDIPLLVGYFVKRFNTRLRKHVQEVAPETMALLLAHDWPGNIRELENAVERCVLFASADRIAPHDLPPEVKKPEPRSEPRRDGPRPAREPSSDAARALDAEPEPRESSPELAQPLDEGGLKEAVREATARVERELIVRALSQTGDNVTHAARLLKISRKSLQIKMKELGLREESP
jgi:two-component system, NtrC family, response regulator AtoC